VIEGIGDDCAVLSSGASDVVTTDVLVENHHFKLKWSNASQLAKRAFAQNFADVYAMGAKGTALVVSLVVSKEALQCQTSFTENDAWIRQFADGLAEIALKNEVAVVGGDLSFGEKVAINITAFGTLEGRKPILRSSANIGDLLAVCGEMGWSAKGFELLQKQKSGQFSEVEQLLVERYLVPEPQYQNALNAAFFGATSMMDISDGLSVDMERLANSSSVGFEVDDLGDFRIRNSPKVLDNQNNAQLSKNIITKEQFYFGGEDHGFLATFPREKGVPNGWEVIGRAVEINPNRSKQIYIPELNSLVDKQWDHFSDQTIY
jgi:thiamine-monophosphate kinase